MQNLDWLLGEVKKGELVVISGLPFMGRTALLRQILAQNFTKQKNMYFELDDFQRADTFCALVCLLGNVTTDDYLGKGDCPQKEIVDSIFGVIENNRDFNLYFSEKFEFIRYVIEIVKQKYTHGLDAVYIDGFENVLKDNEIGASVLAESLKKLAEELDITIYITARKKRGEERAYYGGVNYFLGSFASKIINIERKDYLATANELDHGLVKKGETKISIIKNNSGVLGGRTLYFDYDHLGFFENPFSK